MNKPRQMGSDGRGSEESRARWADMVRAMDGTDDRMEPSAARPEEQDMAFYEDEAELPDRSVRRSLVGAAVLLAIIGWLGFAAWALIPGLAPAGASALLLTVAAVACPLLLLAIMAAMLWRPDRDPAKRWSAYALGVSAEADRSLEYLAAAETRLRQAYATLERQAGNAHTLAEGSAEAVLTATRRIEAQSNQAETALRTSGAAAAEALSLVKAIEETAPELDERLTALNRTLTQSGAALGTQSNALEEQMRGAAIAAEEAHLQLTHAHQAAVSQMASLRDGARDTGEELTAMAELASARVELILERARTAMSTAREGLQDHMAALAALSDRGEQSAIHVRSLSGAVEEIGQRLSTLEREADSGQTRIAGHLAALGAQAERVGNALQQSNTGAAHLIERTEMMLLALDSNIREIDESLPAALDRFDTRLLATEARLGDAAALAEGMAGTADGAARHLEQASETLVAQSQAVEASIDAGEASLARHTTEIAAMRTALDDSAAVLARMIDKGAPQLLAATERMREEALVASARAEEAITHVAARAAQLLTEASGSALDAAVSEKVTAQIAQIADIADNAVKSAHRATDHLMREMMAIADTATDLERRMAAARATEEVRDRDHIAERSAQIIAALNDSAVDVTRWFAQEIGQREWASYLSGDKSLFARRAARLVSSAEMKQVLARYEEDEAFRDLVSRYVADFEAMLAEVLEAKQGHTLAIALLSSDLGKLYVALAQSIERLRIG